MTAKEKQMLKENSKALAMCNNDPKKGQAGKKCARDEKPEEEPEPSEASDQEAEHESAADEEETEYEEGQEGADEDEQVSGKRSTSITTVLPHFFFTGKHLA